MSVAACTSTYMIEDVNLAKGEVLVILAKRHLAGKMTLQLLDHQERVRYHAYVFEADRQRHLLAHGLKRKLLARFTDATLETLQFCAGHAGKPYLSCTGMHFNISHSGDWVALAFSTAYTVGVDVEQARSLDYKDLLTSIAHPQDDLPLFHQNPDQDFLARWSIKEAVTKCQGLGLSMPFTSLQLNYSSDAIYTCAGKENIWHGRHFIRDDTHVAVAVPGSSIDANFQIMEILESSLCQS